MNIGLDFDDTYTADPALWDHFITDARQRGHDIRFVTFRFESARSYDNSDIKQIAFERGIPLIFCNGVQKDAVTRSLGWVVDVWIDDFPVGIPLGNHLSAMASGVRINDDKKRTQLTKNSDGEDKVYSDTPLQIGFNKD